MEQKESFFTQYGKSFLASDIKKDLSFPFKNHPQFSILVDILSRKEQHHAIVCSNFSTNIHTYFLEAFVQYLIQESTPPYLHESQLIFLNLNNISLTELKQLSVEKDFDALRDYLNNTNKYLIIATTQADFFSRETKKTDERFLRKQIEALLTHPKCRLLFITTPNDYVASHYLNDDCAVLHLAKLTETDCIAILNQYRIELEYFHNILIPEELLNEALFFAKRYLSAHSPLEKALQLLDSSAARTSLPEAPHHISPFTPVLTTSILLTVLSNWTMIPLSHLETHTFNSREFTKHMQQRIFGQDIALTVLNHELLQAHTKLHEKSGPFSCFLFTGAEHTGKKTMAIALTEQLFNQTTALYFAQPHLTHLSLAEMKLQNHADKKYYPLKDIITHTPYAIILFENIETLSASTLESLQEILSTGYLHDLEGNQYNFQQSILILSTAVGKNALNEFNESARPDEDIYTMDLMQLVMNEQKNEPRTDSSHYSLHEIIEKITPEITMLLPLSLTQHLSFVPFVALNKSSIEKIIRLQLKILGKKLDALYSIELGYAPEVIRFLTNIVLSSHNANHAIKQLYFCAEQAVATRHDEKNQSNQLFLQLNETGHLLRCDWLPATARQHTS